MAKKPARKYWSWEDPNELSVGPGAYNLPSAFNDSSSCFHNSPKVAFPRSQKLPRVYSGTPLDKSSVGADSPSGWQYNPKHDFTKPTVNSSSFARARVKRIQQFDEFKDRSPGPVYNTRGAVAQCTGGCISRSVRKGFSPQDTPSPGQYHLERRHSHGSFSFKGAYNPEKQYLPNILKLFSGKHTPSPNAYKVSSLERVRGSYIAAVGRPVSSKIDVQLGVPGPGSYNVANARSTSLGKI